MKKTLEILGIKSLNLGACTGTKWIETNGEILTSLSPNTGETIGQVKQTTKEDYEKVLLTAQEAFKSWRKVPAPKRGEIVRQMGDALREYKEPLGKLVSWEMGKIYQEGLGEVQEMIDICDFAVGQSRMLYGMTTHSEREDHRMFEQYHPLGIVGVISAYNFPVAVWAWNAMLALIAGDVVVWKPSSKVPLCAVAVHNIMAKVLADNHIQEGVINLVIGSSRHIGDDFLKDRRVPLISATGSTRMGIHVARTVAERLGRSILELGGNNAIILTKDSDLQMAIPAIVFGAVGTTGQRCTSTRRVIITEEIYDKAKANILDAYGKVTQHIGSSVAEGTLVGPMIDKGAVEDVLSSIEQVKEAGGKILFGGQKLSGEGFESGCYMMPAVAEVENHYEIVQEETFGPLLYLIKAKDIHHAIELHNDVPQGLSSAIFSNNIRETELFLSAQGSDCGIANVNIGTSGAEIGGAFGGEKDTGGGRESGSDAWKTYMRRQTNTINYGEALPLAQGIKFDY
ncbi:MAG: aldehyde dehydrogenase family protein [Bacteroidetes bacterium]|nr:MAG: aldehyde dehydrogenase family protein [Bacteroidota bacterium]